MQPAVYCSRHCCITLLRRASCGLHSALPCHSLPTPPYLCPVLAKVFLTGPKFKGVKMLPPGVHFLSYQAVGSEGAVGPPVSTLLHLQPRQVVVRRWDPAAEGLAALQDEDEVRLLRCC